jgi:hypothetical protein
MSWQGWAILVAIFVVVGIVWQIARKRKSSLLVA